MGPPEIARERPVHYYFEPDEANADDGEEERRELTKEEYDARIEESLPEPDHAP